MIIEFNKQHLNNIYNNFHDLIRKIIDNRTKFCNNPNAFCKEVINGSTQILNEESNTSIVLNTNCWNFSMDWIPSDRTWDNVNDYFFQRFENDN